MSQMCPKVGQFFLSINSKNTLWSNSRSSFPKSTLSLLFIQILLWLKNRIAASRKTTTASTNKQVKGKQDKNPLLTSPRPKCKAHPSTALTLTLCLKQRRAFWLWQELRKSGSHSVFLSIIICLKYFVFILQPVRAECLYNFCSMEL